MTTATKHIRAIAIFTTMACAIQAFGHGLPIGVGVVSGKLTTSLGIDGANGYASRIFINPDEDGEMDHVTLPTFGKVALTTVPGFDISNMDVGSGLYLNVIPRPVNSILPVQGRLLWYANGTTVTVAPNGESLTVAGGFGQINVPQTGTPTPASLKVADPEAEEIGEHFDPLRYMLDNDPTAALGTYGFFGYLSSPSYAASDPFLVVFNNGLDNSTVLEAGALAVNAAAFLPGDFDHNDRVDAADYVIWRNTGGSAADFSKWRGDFGATWPIGSGAFSIVPEPASWVPAVLALGWVVSRWRVRRLQKQ